MCYKGKFKICVNRCGIVGVDDGQIDLSLRESHLGGELVILKILKSPASVISKLV